MPEYIDREKALKLLESAQAWGWSNNTLYDEMKDLPSADVAPIVHAKWILEAKNRCCCSKCLFERNIETQYGWDYCTNCGARCDL